MIELEIELDGRTFDAAEAAAQHLHDTLDREVDAGMARVSLVLLHTLNLVKLKLQQKHSNPWNGRLINDSPLLQRRSGGGLQSIADSIKMIANTSDIVAGQITTGKMTMHETGGTKTARGRFLTIPLPAAMDSRGVPIKSRARDWNDTFIARSKRGSLLIFQRSGKDVIPLYLLKKSVRIPARLGMDETFTGQLPYFEAKAFDQLCDALHVR